MFADFDPDGSAPKMTLGADLAVSGSLAPRPLSAPATVTQVGDYRVRLDGTLRAGEPVTDLQPYLGAYGHLVVLREGGLAYLYVHPDGEPGDGKARPGSGASFFAEAPTVGRYRLYLDFKHRGVVRTAEVTEEIGRGHPSAAADDHGGVDHREHCRPPPRLPIASSSRSAA